MPVRHTVGATSVLVLYAVTGPITAVPEPAAGAQGLAVGTALARRGRAL